MPTKAEGQALAFLAGVALLGAGVRAFRAREPVSPAVDLDRQITAVEAPAPGPGRGAARTRAKSVRSRSRGGFTSRDSSNAAAGIAATAAPDPSLPPSAVSPAKIDLDVATQAEIERLPGIGPTLAKRIVTNRDLSGVFGCLGALRLVKGIGPKTLRRLDSLVSFSGVPRALCDHR